MNYTVVLPAAGSGKRMGASHNKLFLELNNKPILAHTLGVFQEDPWCTTIVLAIKEQERAAIEQLVDRYTLTKVQRLVQGGDERQHSVYEALKAAEGAAIVLVHDAARPFILQKTIHALVEKASADGGAIAAVKAKDTMKRVVDGKVQETVDRETLWSVQTPQAFQYSLLLEAAEQARIEGFLGTDEAMLAERAGIPVYIVESSYENQKMTTPEDLLIGELILKRREETE
ncbi:2-C-methyl-D-erythritol 4-phosphate cytidylyltransferase [Chryseomicrobium sp. FSL W7-1435]|uniref:2-C-methyl-D-erythritol 4-phosphate cytidylyltransferase n=1 Tax=Chryseomicrobium sp. FSL W7-1435 TaxID=2921704 RepID=UPI003159E675